MTSSEGIQGRKKQLTTGVDSRTDTGNRQETGLAGQTQIFVRGPHQPASMMGALCFV